MQYKSPTELVWSDMPPRHFEHSHPPDTGTVKVFKRREMVKCDY